MRNGSSICSRNLLFRARLLDAGNLWRIDPGSKERQEQHDMSDKEKEQTALQLLDLIVNGPDEDLFCVLEESRIFLKPTFEKHPAVLKWKAWLASKEGQQCSSLAGLSGAKSDTYLRNRLYRAWDDGYQNGLKDGANKAGGSNA